jgi:hypothetical protein
VNAEESHTLSASSRTVLSNADPFGRKLRRRHESTRQCILDGLLEKVRSKPSGRAVREGSERTGNGNRADPGAIDLVHVRMVEDDAGWYTKPPAAPGRR